MIPSEHLYPNPILVSIFLEHDFFFLGYKIKFYLVCLGQSPRAKPYSPMWSVGQVRVSLVHFLY